MARDDRTDQPPADLREAQISLMGTVDEAMAETLRDQLNDPPEGSGSITIEMTTLGGDPELARRMLLDVEEARKRLKSRRLVFYGKSVVYSAGCTFMAAFPRKDRFLSPDAVLLIHCRQLDKTLELSGPLRASKPKLEALIHQLDTGVRLEEENFAKLIDGSDVEMEELLDKALYNWYVPAEEALERRLVGGIVEP